jgi:hypothetical protein
MKSLDLPQLQGRLGWSKMANDIPLQGEFDPSKISGVGTRQKPVCKRLRFVNDDFFA